MTPTVSELCVSVTWGEVRGHAWGPERGRPVLCLHGWADNCGSFSALIPLLPKAPKPGRNSALGAQWGEKSLLMNDTDEFRYVALDLAGHGLSSHRPPGVFYCVPSYALDVRRVAEALQLQKFTIIGHSMGGQIAAMFCALYPEMVEGLVLLDSYGFLSTELGEIPNMMRQAIDETIHLEKKMEDKKRVYTREAAVRRLLAANPSMSEESARVLLKRGLVEAEEGFVFSRDLRVNSKSLVRFTLEQSLEMVARVRSSLLVVLAEQSFPNSFSNPLQQKHASIVLQSLRDRNFSVVTVPGDHHVHLNHPEAVAPFLCDFLRNKVLPASREREMKSNL